MSHIVRLNISFFIFLLLFSQTLISKHAFPINRVVCHKTVENRERASNYIMADNRDKFSRKRKDMSASEEEESRREEAERLLGQAGPANQNNDFVFDYPYFSKLLLISFCAISPLERQ